jgi:hypothetical protein
MERGVVEGALFDGAFLDAFGFSFSIGARPLLEIEALALAACKCPIAGLVVPEY